MSKADIDYKNTYFEFPELTRIHSKPTTDDLITVKRQVRANASTVHTALGGGHNGNLGMTCTPLVYATVPNLAPCQRPNAPPPLQVQPGATQFQIHQVRDEHAEDIYLLKEVLAVKRALKQKLWQRWMQNILRHSEIQSQIKFQEPSQKSLNTYSMHMAM